MIYVLAGSLNSAIAFIGEAKLPKNTTVITNSAALDGTMFDEADEVFLIDPGLTLKQVANRCYGKSWPRPHIYKDITRIKQPMGANA